MSPNDRHSNFSNSFGFDVFLNKADLIFSSDVNVNKTLKFIKDMNHKTNKVTKDMNHISL